MRRGQLLWSRSDDAIHRALGRLRTGNLQGPSLPIETSGGSRGGTQPPFFSFAPSNREREEIQGLTIIRSSKIGYFFASNIDEQTGGSSLIIIRVTVNLKRRVYSLEEITLRVLTPRRWNVRSDILSKSRRSLNTFPIILVHTNSNSTILIPRRMIKFISLPKSF